MWAPCEETLIQSENRPQTPCKSGAGPWILTATILGSSMAFIDKHGRQCRCPPRLAEGIFTPNVVDVQWVIESYGIFLSSADFLAGRARPRRLVWPPPYVPSRRDHLRSGFSGLCGPCLQHRGTRESRALFKALAQRCWFPGSLSIIGRIL